MKSIDLTKHHAIDILRFTYCYMTTIHRDGNPPHALISCLDAGCSAFSLLQWTHSTIHHIRIASFLLSLYAFLRHNPSPFYFRAFPLPSKSAKHLRQRLFFLPLSSSPHAAIDSQHPSRRKENADGLVGLACVCDRNVLRLRRHTCIHIHPRINQYLRPSRIRGSTFDAQSVERQEPSIRETTPSDTTLFNHRFYDSNDQLSVFTSGFFTSCRQVHQRGSVDLSGIGSSDARPWE